MKSPITKFAAAAVIIVVLTLSMHLWNKSSPTAYAFEQTIKAMQGKKSFHIQTYWQSKLKDEYWAEFDENGRAIRYRQEELGKVEYSEPIITVWEDNIRFKYYPKPDDIFIITNIGNTESDLDEFDPQTTVQKVYEQVVEGSATIEIQEPVSDEEPITITVARTDSPLGGLLLVDPDTDFVTWAEIRQRTDDGNWMSLLEIDVLEYNQTIDTKKFELNPSEDTIIIDQVSQEVGLAQDQMSDEEAAFRIIHQFLNAWAAGDYKTAGNLFGGAPPELLTNRYSHLRPAGSITIDKPEPIEYIKPMFKVQCQYDVVHNGLRETIEPIFDVMTVDGQPGRWYVRYQLKI
jgi:hypothetical protein